MSRLVARRAELLRRDKARGPAPAGGDSDHYLQVLLSDYELLRQDLQSVDQITATLMGIAVALIGALGAFLLRVCDFANGPCSPPKLDLWSPVYAILPLPPLAILGYVGTVGNVNTLRVYYLRLIERAIARESGSRSEELAGQDALTPGISGMRVTVPSFIHLQLELTGLHRGSVRTQFLFLAIYIAVGVLFIGTVALSVWLVQPTLAAPPSSGALDWFHTDWRWFQFLAGLYYSFAIGILIRTLWVGTVGGRQFWLRMVRGLSAEWARTLGQKERSRHQGRSIGSYLVLPRPGDFVAKAPILPASALIVAWLSGNLSADWVRTVLIFVLAFELVLYQARYILNDLRGLRLDAAYSLFKRHTRFPQPPEPSHIRAAVLVMLVRLLLVWLVAGLWLDEPYTRLLRIAALVVVAHTGIYEALKTWASNHRDAPLTMTASRALVLVSVGVGYGLRACLGLLLGLAGVVDPLLVGLAGVAFTALGSMFVAMVWVIDGLTQVPGETPADLPTCHTTRVMHHTRTSCR